MGRFDISFHEFAFLVEACIPKRPIARTSFFEKVIDKHYHVLTEEERSFLYDWIKRNPSFKMSIEKKDSHCIAFEARYNPDNQYMVTYCDDEVKTSRCFRMNGNYHKSMGCYIDKSYIRKIEKI